MRFHLMHLGNISDSSSGFKACFLSLYTFYCNHCLTLLQSLQIHKHLQRSDWSHVLVEWLNAISLTSADETPSVMFMLIQEEL